MPVVVRHKERVGPDRGGHQRAQLHLAACRLQPRHLAVFDAQLAGRLWVDLDPRLRRLTVQKAEPPCLRPAQVVIDHAPRRQPEWIITTRLLDGWPVGDREHLGLAVLVRKLLGKEARRSRVILRRTRPEDTLLLLNLLPRDAGVISDRSLGRHPHLRKDVRHRVVGEILTPTEPLRQLDRNPPVFFRFAQRRHRAVVLDDAPLKVRRRALVLAPDRRRQHHISQLCRLRHEEIDHNQRIQLLECPLHDLLLRK